MSDIFEGASEATIIERVQAAVELILFIPVQVRVSDARHGYRNLAFDMPPCRRTALASRNLRIELMRALERAGVTAAPHALAPRVEGQILGSVWVGGVPARPSAQDFSDAFRRAS